MVKSRSKAIPATTIISGITSSHNRVATHHYPTEQITNDAESDNSGVWMFLFMLSVFIHKIAQSRANFVSWDSQKKRLNIWNKMQAR